MAYKLGTNKSKGKRLRLGKIKLLVGLLVVVIVIIGLFLIHQHKFSRKIIPSTQSKSTVSSSKSSSSSSSVKNSQLGSSSSSSSAPTTPDKSTPTLAPASSGAAPATPTGQFVSNHKPGANGSPTSEESVCSTTPGATCYIEFTMGSTVKKLNAETADANGSAYWNWDVGNAGFTSGSWQVTAVATDNGKSASANDATPLEVQ